MDNQEEKITPDKKGKTVAARILNWIIEGNNPETGKERFIRLNKQSGQSTH